MFETNEEKLNMDRVLDDIKERLFCWGRVSGIVVMF